MRSRSQTQNKVTAEAATRSKRSSSIHLSHSKIPTPSLPYFPPGPTHTLYSSLSSSFNKSRRLAPMCWMVGPGSPKAHRRSSEAKTITPRGSQTQSKLSRKDTRARVTMLCMLLSADEGVGGPVECWGRGERGVRPGACQGNQRADHADAVCQVST